jgi:hypothetical protein
LRLGIFVLGAALIVSQIIAHHLRFVPDSRVKFKRNAVIVFNRAESALCVVLSPRASSQSRGTSITVIGAL